MSSALLCIGASHRTASIAARERLALSASQAAAFATEVLADPDILELVTIATCNRTEVYVHTSDMARASECIHVTLAQLGDLSAADLRSATETWSGPAAAEHLLRVASGLESVVLGEAEILGQVKAALRTAHDLRACGPYLDRLFRGALETGKAVRSRTGLAAGRASVGSVAAGLVADRLGSLDGRRVVVVGAGEMGELALTSLTAHGATNVMLSNRGRDRAIELAHRFGATYLPFDALGSELAGADAIISATAAPHPVITRADVEAVVGGRDGRSLVLVDLAVPRDVEPSVSDLPAVELFDLDDIERRVADAREGRELATDDAEAIVADGVAAFSAWQRSLDVVPAIRGLRARAEVLRAREVERLAPRFAHLAPEDRRLIDQLTRGVVNKLLHQPTVRLRERAATSDDGTAEAWADTVADLFDLDRTPDRTPL